MKLFIRFRKKYILPIKWSFKLYRKIRGIELKSVKKILEKKKEITKDLLAAERKRDYDQVEVEQGRLMLINYILGE